MFGSLMHVVKWLEAQSIIYGHCTGTVMRKLIKLNCNDMYGNLCVHRSGRAGF